MNMSLSMRVEPTLSIMVNKTHWALYRINQQSKCMSQWQWHRFNGLFISRSSHYPGVLKIVEIFFEVYYTRKPKSNGQQ